MLGWFGLGGSRIWLVLILLAALGGGYAGYKLTSNHYLAKEARQLQKELLTQEIHRREVESLLRRKEELERLLDELSDQADKDPNAGRPALGRDSVRRINKVR